MGKHQTPGVLNRLGNPEPLLPEGAALGERAQFGMARGENGTGVHGGQDKKTEALAAPLHVEVRPVCPRQSIARR